MMYKETVDSYTFVDTDFLAIHVFTTIAEYKDTKDLVFKGNARKMKNVNNEYRLKGSDKVHSILRIENGKISFGSYDEVFAKRMDKLMKQVDIIKTLEDLVELKSAQMTI